MIRLITTAILAVGCAAEPIEASLCDQASATLARCAGQVPEGFAAACDADPERIATSVLSEADIDSCPDLAKADSVGEQAFVDACVIVVNASYWIVWARSPSSEPMPRELRDRLRPWFGDLVDTTRVSWNAGLLTHWRVLGRDLVFDEDTTAQTFGDEIFLRESRTNDDRQVVLVGHELAHARQYREYGGVIGFAREYCTAFYDASYSYRSNALEVEAFDLQNRIKKCLAYGTDCP